jgi:DGQHR domain-containing protein
MSEQQKQYELVLDVLQVDQPVGTFYVASIPARNVVEIAYADVRRLAAADREVERYLGIQRKIVQKRVGEIRKYISGSDASFPTAVVLSVDQRCATYEKKSKFGGVLTLTSYATSEDEDHIPWDKIAQILDGQHRIAGFLGADNKYIELESEFDLVAAIFVGADISEQANIFATVNLAQSKVNRSLAYDLKGLDKTRSPLKTCHNVAVMLDEESTSPFYERIKRLGVATPGRIKEPLTQAVIVESLVKFISPDPLGDRNELLDGGRLIRADGDFLEKHPFRNMFIDEMDYDIAEIIYNYFTAVRNRWPESWEAYEKAGNLLPRSSAFQAFMTFLRVDLYNDIVKGAFGKVPTPKAFDRYLDGVKATDKDFTTRAFVPGSGGQSAFLKLLRGEVRIEELTSRTSP